MHCDVHDRPGSDGPEWYWHKGFWVVRKSGWSPQEGPRLTPAYLAARGARFEHDEGEKRISFSSRGSYARRLGGWATKVYGDDWEDSPGYDVASERFDRWLEERGESD
jgi:hypothetical protein